MKIWLLNGFTICFWKCLFKKICISSWQLIVLCAMLSSQSPVTEDAALVKEDECGCRWCDGFRDGTGIVRAIQLNFLEAVLSYWRGCFSFRDALIYNAWKTYQFSGGKKNSKIHFWYLFLHYILIICFIRTEKVPDFKKDEHLDTTGHFCINIRTPMYHIAYSAHQYSYSSVWKFAYRCKQENSETL